MEPQTTDDSLRRFSVPLAVLVAVIVVGTVGYYLIWREFNASWLDALYMTFITITTVGYGEIHPLEGRGRIFTIGVSVTGIASLFYLFSAVMDRLVSLRLDQTREKRRMKVAIASLSGHIILAGLGRMGRRAALELAEEEHAFVIIEKNDEALDFARENGFHHVVGDASEDAVLQKAGIGQALGLIATTNNDASNAFIAMSARALQADLLIVARAESDTSADKLRKAGADRVLDPYAIGGRRLANLTLHPAAIDFLETTLKRGQNSLDVEAFEILENSYFVGKTLTELDIRKRCGVNILAVLRAGESITNPDSDFRLSEADQLIALGTKEQLTRLEDLNSMKKGARQGVKQGQK